MRAGIWEAGRTGLLLREYESNLLWANGDQIKRVCGLHLLRVVSRYLKVGASNLCGLMSKTWFDVWFWNPRGWEQAIFAQVLLSQGSLWSLVRAKEREREKWQPLIPSRNPCISLWCVWLNLQRLKLRKPPGKGRGMQFALFGPRVPGLPLLLQQTHLYVWIFQKG